MKIDSPNVTPEHISIEAARMAGVIAAEVRDLVDELINIAGAQGFVLAHPKRGAGLQKSLAQLVQLAINREFRMPQKEMAQWVAATFGASQAESPEHRAFRHLEEVIELAQACGVAQEKCHSLVQFVFSKERGEPFKELGGAFTTLLAAAAACGVDLWEAYQAEVDRIESKSLTYWQQRNKAKDKLGFCPDAIRSAPLTFDPIGNVLSRPPEVLAGRVNAECPAPDVPGCALACGHECTQCTPGFAYVKLSQDERRALLSIPPDSLEGPAETEVPQPGAAVELPADPASLPAPGADTPLEIDLPGQFKITLLENEAQAKQYSASKLQPTSNADAPLQVALQHACLVISMGIERLAYCFEEAEGNQVHDDATGDFHKDFTVSDPVQFAKDVIRAMNDESETGATPLNMFIEKMANAAAEDGSLGITEGNLKAAPGGKDLIAAAPGPDEVARQVQADDAPCKPVQGCPNGCSLLECTPATPGCESAIKVFKLNDCDWVAAASLQEAIEFYLGQVGTPKEKATDALRKAEYDEYIDEPHQVGKETMNRLSILDECTDPEGARIKRTFNEELIRLIACGTAFPVMFCSTEY